MNFEFEVTEEECNGRDGSSFLLVYQGRVDSSRKGGAKHHFIAMANALSERLEGDVVAVVPRFWNIPPLAGFAPGVECRGLKCGPRGGLGFLIYEMRKCLLLARVRFSRRGKRRRLVYMPRLDALGVAVVVARLLGFRTVIEANGILHQEVAARGNGRGTVWLAKVNGAVQLLVADLCLAVTDGIRDALVGEGARKAITVPNGVDLDRFPLALARTKGADGRLVFSGAVTHWVDLASVLEALRRLKEANPETPWHLDVLGDGARTAEFQKLAADLGVDDAVEWAGWVGQDEVARRVSWASVGLAPLSSKGSSQTCGSPLKVFEYLAMGRPVVGAEVDGIRELTSERVLTYTGGNAEELALQIRSALNMGELSEGELVDLRRAHGWGGRAGEIVAAFRGDFGSRMWSWGNSGRRLPDSEHE